MDEKDRNQNRLIRTLKETLLRPPASNVMVEKRGRFEMSYIPHHVIRDRLNRTFGPHRWSTRLTGPPIRLEENTRDGKWKVVYGCTLALTIVWPDGSAVTHEEPGSDVSVNSSLADACEMAFKACQSIAMRRCAMNLGPYFGLSLYEGGDDHSKLPMDSGALWDKWLKYSTEENGQ